MLHWFILFAVVVAATTPVCYDMLLGAPMNITRDATPLWSAGTRQVFGAALTNTSVLFHTGATMERFALPSGARVGDVPLADAPRPPASVCATATSLFATVLGAARIDHFDLVTGRRRASIESPEFALEPPPMIACGVHSSELFVVLPAVRAVWALSTEDALPTRVVARFGTATPSAVRLAGDRLFITLGRPAFAVAVVSTAGGSITMLPVSAVSRADSIAVSEDGRMVLALDRATGETRALAYAGDASVVIESPMYARRLDALLTTRVAIRNGVVVDVFAGTPETPVDSALTAQGNLGEMVAFCAADANASTAFVVMDTRGEMAEFSAANGTFTRYYEPLSGALSHVLSMTPTALLYATRDGGVYTRIGSLDTEDTLLAGVGAADRGVVSATRACLINASSVTTSVVCYMLDGTVDTRHLVFPPHPTLFSVAWGADGASVVLIWPEVEEHTMRFVRVDIESDRIVVDRLIEHVSPIDTARWGVQQVSADVLLVRWGDRSAWLVSADDGQVVSRALEDRLFGERVMLMASGTAVCTDDDPTPPPSHRGGHTNAIVVVVGFVLAVLCAAVVFGLLVIAATTVISGGVGASSSSSRWQRLSDRHNRGCLKALCCNRDMQTCIYLVLSSCVPCAADRVNTWMQRTWTEAVYVDDAASLREGGVTPAAVTSDGAFPSRHWDEVDVNDR